MVDYIQNYEWKWKGHVNEMNTKRIPPKFLISQEDKNLSDVQ
jgi:hypothetical protein